MPLQRKVRIAVRWGNLYFVVARLWPRRCVFGLVVVMLSVLLGLSMMCIVVAPVPTGLHRQPILVLDQGRRLVTVVGRYCNDAAECKCLDSSYVTVRFLDLNGGILTTRLVTRLGFLSSCTLADRDVVSRLRTCFAGVVLSFALLGPHLPAITAVGRTATESTF